MNKFFRQDITNRVVSGFSSGALLVLIGQQLGLTDFARLQIYFTYGALLYWICDFGLIGLAYVYSVQSNLNGLAACWKMRMRILTFPSLALLTLLTFKVGDSVLILIVLIGLLESYVDSNLPIRQLLRSSLANNLSITFRKASQLILLLGTEFYFDTLTLIHVVFIYGVPSGLVFLADSIFFGKYPGSPSIPVLKKSAKYFFQSSGTNLASLDLLVIDKFGFTHLIYPYTLARRFYSFLMIPGTTFLRISMRDKQAEDNNYRMFLSSLKSTLLITFIASLIAFASFVFFSVLFLDQRYSLESFLIILSLVFLPLLGTISTNLNGVLVSQSKYRFAAFSTFFSSFVYLLLIFSGFALEFSELFVLIIAIYINLICEIWLEHSFLFSEHSLRKIVNFSFSALRRSNLGPKL